MIALKTLLALVLFLPFANAQTREKIAPPEFERECVEDEEGLKQWADLKVKCEPCKGRGTDTCKGCEGRDMPKCTECDGKKLAPCRTCGGHKVLPDPLVELSCPLCRGSGWFDCGQCAGPGFYFTSDQYGNRNKLVCRACDKKGRYKCLVCNGKRIIPTVRIKKKLPSVSKLKDLVKLRGGLQECLKALVEFEPGERGNKSFKAFEAIFKVPGKKTPALKSVVKLLDTVLDGIRKVGAGYEGYEASNTHQILMVKDRTRYMLQHQILVLDLCIARVEHNEKVQADK